MVLGSNNPFGVVLATLLGIPMYADIFGTIPVAEALLGKGAQLGTVLSFMMAVTTLSLRAHFYTGNYICLYRATCGAVPDFEKSQSGNLAKSQIPYKGIISPCGKKPILL